MSKSNSFAKITKWTLVFICTGLGLMSKFSTWRFILKSCLIGASLIALFTKNYPQPDVAQILNRETDTSFFKSDWELRASYLRNGREFYECFLISENDVDTVDFSVLSSDICPDFDATYQRWLDLLNGSYRYTKLFPKDVYDDYCIKYTNPTEKYMWAYFQSVALREMDEETGERKTGYYKNKYPILRQLIAP
ncbi:MAG: hypothetical protein MJ238_03640 [Bacilli bacterium]|nr:hypothetical protein [Bacilli bacterium]